MPRSIPMAFDEDILNKVDVLEKQLVGDKMNVGLAFRFGFIYSNYFWN